MLKSVPLIASLRKSSPHIKVLIPRYYFSNSQQPNASETKSGQAQANPEHPSRSQVNESPGIYFPIKRINFSRKNIFPIYLINKNEVKAVPKTFSLISSFGLFFAYAVPYVFFFDIHNYWHLLPLTYLFYRGGKNFFTDVKVLGSIVQSVFLNKDGKTLIVTVPKTPVYYKHQEDIDLSDFGKFKDEIALTVDLEKAKSVGFMTEIFAESIKDKDFVEIKTQKQREKEEEEKQQQEEMEMAEGIITPEGEDLEKRTVLIEIERGGEIMPLYIDISKNLNKAYSDYLVAIAQKKKIVMRETRGDA